MEVLIVIFFEKYIDVNRVKFRRVSKQAISLILLFSSEPGQQASDLGIIEAKKWPGWRRKSCTYDMITIIVMH